MGLKKDLSTMAVLEDILFFLRYCGLDFCCGCDGAVNMVGKVDGAAIRIQ